MRSRRVVLVASLVLAVAVPALGWGKTGHPIINKIAVDVLPESALKAFFKKNQDWLAAHSVDPDRYKAKHRVEEAPRHYLNGCEHNAKIEEYPRTWKAAVEKFGLYEATKNGRLPWVIDETFEQLVQAFRESDGPAILKHAAWLGHYVGDAHVPFHACANHDGQLTGQKGIHKIWEQSMIEHNADEVEKEVRKLAGGMKVAEVPADVAAWAFERIIAGDHLAHEILEKDKGLRTSGREKALFKASGGIAERRLAESATGLASLWHSAWVRAGRPALPAEVKPPEGEAAPPAGKEGEDEHDPVTPGDAKKAEEDRKAKPDEPAKPDAPKPDAPDAPKPDAPKPAAKATKPSARAVKCAIPGLWVRDDEDQPGAVVDFVDDASAAQLAGALPGDVVISVDGAPVNSVGTLKKRLSDYKSGDAVPLTVLRAGAESFIKLRLP